jgi:hypothetical protein
MKAIQVAAFGGPEVLKVRAALISDNMGGFFIVSML